MLWQAHLTLGGNPLLRGRFTEVAHSNHFASHCTLGSLVQSGQLLRGPFPTCLKAQALAIHLREGLPDIGEDIAST